MKAKKEHQSEKRQNGRAIKVLSFNVFYASNLPMLRRKNNSIDNNQDKT